MCVLPDSSVYDRHVDSRGPRKRVRRGAAAAGASPTASSALALGGAAGGASSAREVTIAAEDFAVLRTVASCKQHFLITDYSQVRNGEWGG